jgi:DNA-binding PadR family transcriptional regulator
MESAMQGPWPAQWTQWARKAEQVAQDWGRTASKLLDETVYATRTEEEAPEGRPGPAFGRGRPGWGGPPFMPPFGGPPWLRGPRERRPRPRRGDVRLGILTLLAEQPMHGYQIITELSDRSGGIWRPSPGSVYPTLQQLQDEGLITGSEQDGRRTFSLTDAGKVQAAAAGADGRQAPWDQMTADDHDGAARLRERVAQAAAALMQVSAAGTDQQLERAEQLVAEFTRGLYRVLADDDQPQGAKP